MYHYAPDRAAPLGEHQRTIHGRPVPKPREQSRPDVWLATRPLPIRMQFETWAEQVYPVLEVAAYQSVFPGFDAELEAWDLGRLLLVRSRMPRVGFRRSERRCRSDGLDHWILTAERVPARGATSVHPAALRLCCLDRPVAGRTSGGEAVHLCVPQDLLPPGTLHSDALNGATVHTALGQLLADFMFDLVQRMPELDASDHQGLVASISAMIAAILPQAATQPRHQATLIERARRLVQQQLRSPSLGVDDLCRELGVSRSRLYRLFEPMGGVVHYIRHRRLLDAHLALADTDDNRPIVDIAAERGFIDPAEFSRAFKREFGYRPSDARWSTSHLPPRSRQRPSSGTTLADLLHNLH